MVRFLVSIGVMKAQEYKKHQTTLMVECIQCRSYFAAMRARGEGLEPSDPENARAPFPTDPLLRGCGHRKSLVSGLPWLNWHLDSDWRFHAREGLGVRHRGTAQGATSRADTHGVGPEQCSCKTLLIQHCCTSAKRGNSDDIIDATMDKG